MSQLRVRHALIIQFCRDWRIRETVDGAVQRTACWLTLGLLLLTAAPWARAQGVEQEVDFFTDIQPILREHCYRCHGAEKRNGGLRLHLAKDARRGGDSRKPIVGGTLETNELYRRVATTDSTFRMPKSAPPLSQMEIKLVGRWVTQGTPWPETVSNKKPAQTWQEALLARWEEVARKIDRFAYLRPAMYMFVVVLIGYLLLERGRKSLTGLDLANPTRRQRWLARVTCLRGSTYLLTGGVLTLALTTALVQAHAFKLERELAQEMRSRLSSPNTPVVQAWPPQPVRPGNPKRFGGTYYRGNCERNDKLFNRGNYRTATFHLALCDDQHRPLNVGDPVPPGKLYIRFELERASQATTQLFTPEIMSAVFLSSEALSGDAVPYKHKPVQITPVEKEDRWIAYYPLDEPQRAGAAKLSGLVYVYKGSVGDGSAGGEIHYGIKYDLVFKDGRIRESSELWMGAIYTTSAIARPGLIAFTEWFDDQPIPEITGENPTDPKLLGIPGHSDAGKAVPAAPQSERRSGPDSPAASGS